jgi:hypothetical protein
VKNGQMMLKRNPVSDGGFVIKFDGKIVKRCYKVIFDYDDWTYAVNEAKAKPLPIKVKTIAVVVEKR